MSKTEYIFILGAGDPEMEAIESVVTEAGYNFSYSCTAEGIRVRPHEAYKASPDYVSGFDASTAVVAVECAWEGGPRPLVVVDHHKEGDPGFGLPPEEYWEASSLGQVCRLLGVEPTPERQIIAAADHCLAAAYRGECPGVDPKELGAWRASSRAAFQGRSAADVLRDVIETSDKLVSAPRLEGHPEVLDLRGPTPLPELPEAAARLGGISYVSGPLGSPTPQGVKFTAAGDPAFLRDFLSGEILPELGGRYGDPVRGFAGGYMPLAELEAAHPEWAAGLPTEAPAR